MIKFQVFSNSVAKGLEFYKLSDSSLQFADATIKFTKRLNDLFDSLNRRCPNEGIKINSNDIQVSTFAKISFYDLYDSYHFKVLQDNLKWLNEWESLLVNGKIKECQFLTSSTAEGLRVTILSTIHICQYLLKDCNFSYVLTNKMNQDPLEVPTVYKN